MKRCSPIHLLMLTVQSQRRPRANGAQPEAMLPGNRGHAESLAGGQALPPTPPHPGQTSRHQLTGLLWDQREQDEHKAPGTLRLRDEPPAGH